MSSVRSRLSIMMFLQYFIWGSWGVGIGVYKNIALQDFTGPEFTRVAGCTWLAAIFSPLITGYIADRWFAAERILAVFHLLGALLIGYAATATQYNVLFPVMFIYALLYMPTLALTNAISFENVKEPEKEFPLIRVFGTFGWIVAGWIVGFVLQAKSGTPVRNAIAGVLGDTSPIFAANSFFYMAAASSVVLGLFSFFLPHTPPKMKGGAAATSSRGSVLQLLKQPSFLVFTIASFLICIPLAFYYSLANMFLGQIDAPYPTALQTIGQISEVGFMALMPFFIVRMGVKKLLAVGMLAWVARYFLFGTLSFPLVLIGLILHGVCYDFFFVGSQIYVDNKADLAQRASAQGFLTFITLGVAMSIGSELAGRVHDMFPPQVRVSALTSDGQMIKTSLPDWSEKGDTGLAAELGIKAEDALTPDTKLPDMLEDADRKLKFPRGSLFNAITLADEAGNKDGKTTRNEWRAAQRDDWFHIWLVPGVAAAVTLAIFWIGFRDNIQPRTVVH